MDRLVWMDLGARPAWFPAACALTGATLLGVTHQGGPAFLCLAGLLAGATLLLHARPGAHLLALLSFLALGAGLARWQAAPPSLSVPRRAHLEGEIRETSAAEDATGLVLQIARSEDAPQLAGHAVSLWTRGRSPLLPGQRVLVDARLKPLQGPSNEGERDRLGELSRRGIVATGGFEAGAAVPLGPPPGWRRAMADLHRRLAREVWSLSDDREATNVLLTLSAGDRASIDRDLQSDFAASGLAHILSVSGLHVAVVALAVLWALRRVFARVFRRRRGFEARRWAALFALPAVWIYVVFTGAQAPSMRSGVMATCAFLGLALWRRADPLNALAWAVLGLLLLDPSDCAQLSFQLSVLAVAALILLAPAVRGAVPLAPPDPTRLTGIRLRLARWGETALQTFCASAAVTVASAPLLAGAFHRLSLAGLVSNIVCLPLAGVLTIVGASGAALFALLPSVGGLLLHLGVWISAGLVFCVHAFAALPGATVSLPRFGLWALPFEAGLAAWALGSGRVRWSGALVPLSAAGMWLFASLPSPGLTVTFLSVGHGDAIVLRSGDQVALVDGGGVPQGADTGLRYVLPYLREKGVRRLDLAVLSHPHPDHALGLASTLGVLPVKRLWLGAGSGDGPLATSVIAAAKGAVVERVEAGHPSFRLGEAQIEVLGPPHDRALLENVNNGSVVLRVRHGAVTFLLTGDIEADAEAVLDPGPVTVMKAPHHGSKTSSSPAFLARARPSIAVFSVGVKDRFGAPSAEVVARYRALGADCYRTDRDGEVEIHSDGKTVRVRTFRAGAAPEPARCEGEGACGALARDDRRRSRPGADHR